MREIVRLSLDDGSAPVIDRLSGTHGDARLLARLAADEPRENGQILCALYLADESKGKCRPVTSADLDAAPTPEAPDVCREHELCDGKRDRLSHPERWRRMGVSRAALDTQQPGSRS